MHERPLPRKEICEQLKSLDEKVTRVEGYNPTLKEL